MSSERLNRLPDASSVRCRAHLAFRSLASLSSGLSRALSLFVIIAFHNVFSLLMQYMKSLGKNKPCYYS